MMKYKSLLLVCGGVFLSAVMVGCGESTPGDAGTVAPSESATPSPSVSTSGEPSVSPSADSDGGGLVAGLPVPTTAPAPPEQDTSGGVGEVGESEGSSAVVEPPASEPEPRQVPVQGVTGESPYTVPDAVVTGAADDDVVGVPDGGGAPSVLNPEPGVGEPAPVQGQ